MSPSKEDPFFQNDPRGCKFVHPPFASSLPTSNDSQIIRAFKYRQSATKSRRYSCQRLLCSSIPAASSTIVVILRLRKALRTKSQNGRHAPSIASSPRLSTFYCSHWLLPSGRSSFPRVLFPLSPFDGVAVNHSSHRIGLQLSRSLEHQRTRRVPAYAFHNPLAAFLPWNGLHIVQKPRMRRRNEVYCIRLVDTWIAGTSMASRLIHGWQEHPQDPIIHLVAWFCYQ